MLEMYKKRMSARSKIERSFFSGSHLKISQILEIIFWWSRNSTVDKVFQETGITKVTIVDWFNFIRDVCTQFFLDYPIQIGGVGSIVRFLLGIPHWLVQ